MKCLIVCAGDEPSNKLFMEEYDSSDFKIAVDGGAKVFYENGVFPNLLVGDMDSLCREVLEFYNKADVLIEKFKPEKDLTDTEIAIQKAVELKSDTAVLLGCTGGRFDHSYANILLLGKLLSKGVLGAIKDEVNDIYIKDSNFDVEKGKKYVSFYAFGETVKGLTLDGFKYPLSGYNLNKEDSLCTSNEIISKNGQVRFEFGKLLVIESEKRYT